MPTLEIEDYLKDVPENWQNPTSIKVLESLEPIPIELGSFAVNDDLTYAHKEEEGLLTGKGRLTVDNLPEGNESEVEDQEDDGTEHVASWELSQIARQYRSLRIDDDEEDELAL